MKSKVKRLFLSNCLVKILSIECFVPQHVATGICIAETFLGLRVQGGKYKFFNYKHAKGARYFKYLAPFISLALFILD